jgi:multidrug efflux pump subunit AcrB
MSGCCAGMLAHPLICCGICGLAVIAGRVVFLLSGAGHGPAAGMDEGGFIVDYLMPAGSSLEDTNGWCSAVRRHFAATPEVESTSRRTGLQLGLAAVTEANRGDISVKLKRKREAAQRK